MSLLKQNQKTVREYRTADQHWPATAKEIADWALLNGKWEIPPAAIRKKCAEQMAEAMREEYFTDAKGRRVRLLHPATVKRQGELFTEWDDIRTAPRTHMQLSFQQRRKAVVGECRQLKTDVDSYNDVHSDQELIQISFDFNMDLAEIEAANAA